MDVIVDTNFILSCIRNKLDFADELKFKGFEIIVPEEVVNEIKKNKKPEAETALKIINEYNFKKVSLGKGYVDNGIKKYLDEHKDVYLATLDKELQRRVLNRKIIIRNKKKIDVI